MRLPKRGDVRPDGYTFISSYTNRNGTRCEKWLSPSGLFRAQLSARASAARSRAKKEGVPCDITVDHLEDIYPRDGLCPVLRIPLLREGYSGREDTPSLDRREPSKGYVKGNVAFISNKANRLKAGMTLAQIERLTAYIKGDLDAD